MSTFALAAAMPVEELVELIGLLAWMESLGGGMTPLERLSEHWYYVIVICVLLGIWGYIAYSMWRIHRRMQPGAGKCCQMALETNGKQHDPSCTGKRSNPRSCIYDPYGGNGNWRQQVEACTARGCPLYAVRPTSKANKDDSGADSPPETGVAT